MNKTLVAAIGLGAIATMELSAGGASAWWYSSAIKSLNQGGSFTRAGQTVAFGVGSPPTAVANATISSNVTANTRHRAQSECWNGWFYEWVSGPAVSAVTPGGQQNASYAYCVQGYPNRGRAQLDQ